MAKKHYFKWLNSSETKRELLPTFLHAYVHPCVINDQPHIVYPRGLKDKSPGLFANLTQYYQQQGYALKEDQRSEKHSEKYKNERCKWVPILLFTASLMLRMVLYSASPLCVCGCGVRNYRICFVTTTASSGVAVNF